MRPTPAATQLIVNPEAPRRLHRSHKHSHRHTDDGRAHGNTSSGLVSAATSLSVRTALPAWSLPANGATLSVSAEARCDTQLGCRKWWQTVVVQWWQWLQPGRCRRGEGGRGRAAWYLKLMWWRISPMQLRVCPSTCPASVSILNFVMRTSVA
jgi:hypothetical protein